MESQIQQEHVKQHSGLGNPKGVIPMECDVNRALVVEQHCSPSGSFNKCSRRVSDLSRVTGPVIGPEAEHKGVAKGNQIPTQENRFQQGWPE